MALTSIVSVNKKIQLVSIMLVFFSLFLTTSHAKDSSQVTIENQKRLERVQNMAVHKSLSIDCYHSAKKKYKKDPDKALAFTEKCRAKHMKKQQNGNDEENINTELAVETEEGSSDDE